MGLTVALVALLAALLTTGVAATLTGAFVMLLGKAVAALSLRGLAALLVLAGATTVPATAFVPEVPLTDPPVLLTQICFSISGLCQNCGSTSMTT